MIYAIENDNNITGFPSAKQAKAAMSGEFSAELHESRAAELLRSFCRRFTRREEWRCPAELHALS